MLKRIRLLIGISVFWLALSVLLDGINTLILPYQLAGRENQATLLGLLTFVGLLGGAIVQPIAGAFSDRLRPRLGRKGFIGLGLILSLASLLMFALFQNIVGIVFSYLALQVSASIAQAGQQGLIPDVVEENQRGLASGLKGFMDLTGAMLGFVLLGQFLGSGQSHLALGIIAATLIVVYVLAVFLTPEDRPDRADPVPTKTAAWGEIFRLDFTQQTDFTRLILARFLFLLGIYGIGRFLLLFVAQRLGLPENQAAEQAGNLLAGLALVTILASPLTGWLADRIGRTPLMIAGAIFSAASAILLIWAGSITQILIFGGLMSLGSAAFSGGSWALLADLVPKPEAARFFGLANFSTAGSAAAAGLLGLLIDGTERLYPKMGFSVLFVVAALTFLASILPLKNLLVKEIRENGNKRKNRTGASGLAVLSVQTHAAPPEGHQDQTGRPT